jgi:hypothetical protein
LILFVLGILNLVIFLLISNFSSWSVCKYFICFQFHPLISIFHILYFQFVLNSFFIFNFFLCHFVKVLFVFYFIILSNFMVHYFTNLIFILLIFLGPLDKFIFLFDFTLESNIKFILYIKFDRYSFKYFFILLLNGFFFSISSFNKI